jgi:hypothetical protein
MICSKCGGRTQVFDSREKANCQVSRRRRCMKCGRRFTTAEIPAEELEKVRLVPTVLKEIAGLAARLQSMAADSLGERRPPHEIAKALVRARRRKGFTPTQAANHAGIAYSTLTLAERDGTPSDGTLRKIAVGYGVTLPELLSFATQPKEGEGDVVSGSECRRNGGRRGPAVDGDGP